MARFELVEGTSSKFWEIELDGNQMTVTYGRIGTQGTSQTKSFENGVAAHKEYDKLIAEKTRKGYRGVDNAGTTRGATAATAATTPGAGRSVALTAPKSKGVRNNAATLAAKWGREVPAALAALLASDDLGALQKKNITIRYAGETNARLVFEDPAFQDLSAWMEDVGLGDDIVWEKERGKAFKQNLPLAFLHGDELDKTLLAVRIDDAALPISLFTEGKFFLLWSSLDELLGLLRGTRVDPIEALQERMAAAEKLEQSGRHAEAAALLHSALLELGEMLHQAQDARERLEAAHLRAGYHFFKAGKLDDAEQHYQTSMKLGSSAAAFNLVLMAVQERKDWVLASKRMEHYWKEFAFSDENRLATFRYRALINAMQGKADAAVAALKDVERSCFEGDDLEIEMKKIDELLKDADAPTSSAVTTLRRELAAAVNRWRKARTPHADQSPREWWNGLDEVWRTVFLANLEPRDFYQIPFDADALDATDQQLEAIVSLKRLKIFTVSKPSSDGGLGDSLVPRNLAPLARLAHLEEIDGEQASEPYSLAPLAGLARLRVLQLDGTKVSDLSPLAGHAGIEELNLRRTRVHDLAPLARLPRLKKLNIWKTPVENLSPLSGCVELCELLAGNTQATALPLLPELTKLTKASFLYSRFDRKSANAFEKAHPGCTVEYSLMKK
jgi:predicted DNA-binding WGR domain protein